MKGMVRSIGLTLLLCAGAGTRAVQAQYDVGARALGMGGAFLAIADGEGAVQWNPASVAGQRGHQFWMPSIALQFAGPDSVRAALKGLPTPWDDRFQFARRWSSGVTNLSGAAYTGLATPNFTFSLSAFGKGNILPIDGDGTVGRVTLTPDFTVDALRNAAIQEYRELGTDQAGAEREANKIIQQVQKAVPGATKIALPVFNSRLQGVADVYASTFATVGKQVRPDLRVGLNLKLVGAMRLSAAASFDKATLTDKLADVTNGTASPTLISRLLRQLNLRKPDGTFYAGREIAGDATLTSTASGLELRPSVDAGILWTANKRLQTGLVVHNLVPAHFSSAAPLDTYCDLGAAYVVQPKRLLIAADLTHLLDTSSVRLNAGLEWRVWSPLALRAGVYRGNFTYGLGLGRNFSLAASSGMTLLAFGLGF